MTRTVQFIAVSAAIAGGLCACSSSPEAEPDLPTIVVRTTEFASPPAPVTDALPSAEQLTVLLDAAVDYSVREDDRARLIEGSSDQNLALAQALGAQPGPEHVEFTVVESTGPDTVDASGQGSLNGMDPYPIGPIPFVRSNGEWKVARSFACGMANLISQQPCD